MPSFTLESSALLRSSGNHLPVTLDGGATLYGLAPNVPRNDVFGVRQGRGRRFGPSGAKQAPDRFRAIYGGTTLEGAVGETILVRTNQLTVNGVPRSDISELSLFELRLTRSLTFLFVPRSEVPDIPLIELDADAFGLAHEWSREMRHKYARSNYCGFVWSSHRNKGHRAFVVFDDWLERNGGLASIELVQSQSCERPIVKNQIGKAVRALGYGIHRGR